VEIITNPLAAEPTATNPWSDPGAAVQPHLLEPHASKHTLKPAGDWRATALTLEGAKIKLAVVSCSALPIEVRDTVQVGTSRWPTCGLLSSLRSKPISGHMRISIATFADSILLLAVLRSPLGITKWKASQVIRS